MMKRIFIAAACVPLVACGGGAPMTSAELESKLVSVDEAGVDGLQDGQTARDVQWTPFNFGASTEGASQECRDAISHVGGVTYQKVGSVARSFTKEVPEDAAPGEAFNMISVSLFSSESDEQNLGPALSDVAEKCADDSISPQDGVTYTFKPVDGYEGLDLIASSPGEEAHSVALVGHKDKQMVYVSAIGLPPEEVAAIFDAQMGKF